LCNFTQRSYLGENVLFVISYSGVPVVYLKYPLGFVIHLFGEENSALLILEISKRELVVYPLIIINRRFY